MLKAILFNLDGIITNLSKFHFLAWKSIFSHYGIIFNDEQWKQMSNHSRTYIIKNTLEFNKVKYDDDLIASIDSEKNALYQDLIRNELTPQDVNPNILEIITQARAKDLKVCIVSHSGNAELIIERLGLSKAFDYICCPSNTVSDAVTALVGLSSISSSLSNFFKISGYSGSECIGIENTKDGIDEYNLFNVFSVAINNFDPEISKKACISYHSIVDINLDEIIFKYYTIHTND